VISESGRVEVAELMDEDGALDFRRRAERQRAEAMSMLDD